MFEKFAAGQFTKNNQSKSKQKKIPKKLPLAVALSASFVLMSCASKPSLPSGRVTHTTPVPQKTQATPTKNSAVTNQTSRQIVVHNPQNNTSANTQKTYQNFPVQTAQSYRTFGEWQQDYLKRNPNATSLVAHASLNDRVIDLDSNQAEFVKMPWEYVESAVSSSRVNQGKAKRNEQYNLLMANENRYGVPASIVTAIWGLESSFGAGMGSMDLVDALSSLAYDGRRREFAESQLNALQTMVNRGDAYAEQLKGSWAGGMGHTQFIPTTWLVQGVDGDGDGRINPWSAADALTSTANYLGGAGWVRQLPTFIEVRLPSNFNYTLIGQKLPFSAWQQAGVVAMNGSLTANDVAELWLPAGANGPALLTTKNFDTIKVYNNSASYALAVSLLAKKINGETGISAAWPYHEKPLSNSQIRLLQQNLANRGYDVGKVDGVAGANTRKAFAKWQADNGRIPDGFISQNSANGLIW